MQKGALIEFRLHRERRLAVAERPEGKKKWVVIDEKGQSHIIDPGQIIYEVTGQTYKYTDIANFLKEVQLYLDPSSLEIAWELLVEEGKGVDPEGMAILLFSEANQAQCYAAHSLLFEDKLYFKQKGDKYEPRSMAQVGEIKHQQEVERQKQQELEGFLTRVKERKAGVEVEWQVSDRPRLESLERLATFGEEATGRAAAQETLVALGYGETSQAAFQILVDLGIWNSHENLFLRRSQIPINFSNKVLEVAQQCLSSPPIDPDSQNRINLTHLKVYTIDDESTQEIDDGISLEYLADGRQKLWVHIADPTRLLAPGDDLDLEARKRTTTLYMPTGMVPMFPPDLATGPMSLVQGQICCALSFAIILDAAGAVTEYNIYPSFIKPTYRLTYEDVDEMLELGVQAEPEIEAIAKWAERRLTWRQSQGAIGISMPEAVIKVVGDDITIKLLEDSRSRQLVAEMMILTGEVAARYGQTHNIPLPFRTQPQPELPPEEELIILPAGPVRAAAMRRCMPRSETSIIPARHASLGLDTYLQVTSPIRRYTDLLAHFQIKAHLRGDQLPFSADEMKEVMLGVTSTAQEASLVERQTNRYWGLEYLRRNTAEVWQALMLRWLREDENLGLILLEELGLELAMRFHRSIQLGERLNVKVSYADPRQDRIEFREMIEAAQSAAM